MGKSKKYYFFHLLSGGRKVWVSLAFYSGVFGVWVAGKKRVLEAEMWFGNAWNVADE